MPELVVRSLFPYDAYSVCLRSGSNVDLTQQSFAYLSTSVPPFLIHSPYLIRFLSLVCVFILSLCRMYGFVVAFRRDRFGLPTVIF